MSSPNSRFAPIARTTVASAVRDAIEEGIRSGAMPPGSPLPSERELSEQFDVARTSVREAVQGLLTLGLIEKRGNRSYVVEHLPTFRLDGDDRRKLRVRELFEVREILEPPIVRLAVQKAGEDERQRIAEIARQFEPGMPLDEFRRLDRQFHWALATACGNETLAELSGKVLDSLFASDEFHELLGSRDNDEAVADVIDTSVRAHHRIADAITATDTARAVEEITAHLHDVEDQMVSRMS